jgi:hypothetical protein
MAAQTTGLGSENDLEAQPSSGASLANWKLPKKRCHASSMPNRQNVELSDDLPALRIQGLARIPFERKNVIRPQVSFEEPQALDLSPQPRKIAHAGRIGTNW